VGQRIPDRSAAAGRSPAERSPNAGPDSQDRTVWVCEWERGVVVKQKEIEKKKKKKREKNPPNDFYPVQM